MRVVASRYVKSSDWDSAIDILYGGALALLKAGQGGSGGDLGCFLVEVLGKAEKDCGASEKGACGLAPVCCHKHKYAKARSSAMDDGRHLQA